MAKVVHINCWHRHGLRETQPVQLELFADETKKTGIVGYFDVSAHTQDGFLSTLTQKSIKVIFDVRSSKALPRMKYNHAEVFDYLQKSRIMYSDAEKFINEYQKISCSLFLVKKENMTNDLYVNKLLGSGPCLVLYDSNSANKYLKDFRILFGNELTIV